jgi:hypothetical protein
MPVNLQCARAAIGFARSTCSFIFITTNGLGAASVRYFICIDRGLI